VKLSDYLKLVNKTAEEIGNSLDKGYNDILFKTGIAATRQEYKDFYYKQFDN